MPALESAEQPPPFGRFDPKAFEAPDEARTGIDWRPGARVRLDFSEGSLVDKVGPIFATGLLTGAVVVMGMGALRLDGQFLWGDTEIMAPMAAELAAALPVGWRWEDFKESLAASLDHF